MGVPYTARGTEKPVERMKSMFGEDFYIVRAQKPGLMDAEMASDVRTTFAKSLLIDGASSFDAGGSAADLQYPDWMPKEAFDHFVGTFEKTGFTGALNYYRNI